MHDQHEPTQEEREAGPERLQEEDAMRQAGHDDPDGVRERSDRDDTGE